MRKELITATSLLLIVGMACASGAGVVTTNPVELWSVAIIACAEGINGGIPDGKCTPGQNGDKAIGTTITLADMAGKGYVSGDTDPDSGIVYLTAELPLKYSPHLVYPTIETAPIGNGQNIYVHSPQDATIISQDGRVLVIHVPYTNSTPLLGQQSG